MMHLASLPPVWYMRFWAVLLVLLALLVVWFPILQHYRWWATLGLAIGLSVFWWAT